MKNERSYPVYDRTESKPLSYVDKNKFLAMVASGEAERFGRRGQKLRLFSPNSSLRDSSATMGPSVIQRNAEGSRYAASLVRAWAPRAAQLS
jgi:hypothetical protein